jgi:pSer/pThr/pTyr-binding forkhead associated (FHA) protein
MNHSTMTIDAARPAEPPKGLTLVPLSGPEIDPIVVRPDQPGVIGRQSQCDIQLADPSISRVHAGLEWKRGGWFITDRLSRAGTMLNSMRLEPNAPAPLRDGDVLGLGPWRFAVQFGMHARTTETLRQNRLADSSGRVEAARLAMAIWRDKVGEPVKALSAVEKLLDEVPDDPEALDLVLSTPYESGFRVRTLGRGKQRLVETLQRSPADLERVALLAKIAQAQQDAALRQTTLGAMLALGKQDHAILDELASIDAKLPGKPQIVLDGRALAEIADPDDNGPVAELFAVIAETVTLALGPSLEGLGVGRKNRLDPKGGPPLRLAVAEWMGALGFDTDFELYVGGPSPLGVQGVAGEVPALVIGPEVTAPLTPITRSAVAREVFALRRGICALRRSDDAAIASCVIAVCAECGFNLPNPGYAVFGEVSRIVHKEISRKVKKAAQDVCQRFVQSGQDPRAWAAAARRSIDRMAAIAAGDVSIVLSEVLGAPKNELAPRVRESDRARSLLTFVLSPGYLELRKKLGMGVR